MPCNSLLKLNNGALVKVYVHVFFIKFLRRLISIILIYDTGENFDPSLLMFVQIKHSLTTTGYNRNYVLTRNCGFN